VNITPKELEVMEDAMKWCSPQVQKKDHTRNEGLLILWLTSMSPFLKKGSSISVESDNLDASPMMIGQSKTISESLS